MMFNHQILASKMNVKNNKNLIETGVHNIIIEHNRT